MPLVGNKFSNKRKKIPRAPVQICLGGCGQPATQGAIDKLCVSCRFYKEHAANHAKPPPAADGG